MARISLARDLEKPDILELKLDDEVVWRASLTVLSDESFLTRTAFAHGVSVLGAAIERGLPRCQRD